jgi:hypothetical protein
MPQAIADGIATRLIHEPTPLCFISIGWPHVFHPSRVLDSSAQGLTMCLDPHGNSRLTACSWSRNARLERMLVPHERPVFASRSAHERSSIPSATTGSFPSTAGIRSSVSARGSAWMSRQLTRQKPRRCVVALLTRRADSVQRERREWGQRCKCACVSRSKRLLNKCIARTTLTISPSHPWRRVFAVAWCLDALALSIRPARLQARGQAWRTPQPESAVNCCVR